MVPIYLHYNNPMVQAPMVLSESDERGALAARVGLGLLVSDFLLRVYPVGANIHLRKSKGPYTSSIAWKSSFLRRV